MIGQDFPISDYYKGNVEDAVTLSRTGGWWSAVLLIKEPRAEQLILNVYQWQLTENGWKTRKHYSFKKKKDSRGTGSLFILI